MDDDLGFIGTIGEDDEVPVISESSDSDEDAVKVKKIKKKKKKNLKLSNDRAEEFDDAFEFNDHDDAFENWTLDITSYAKQKPNMSSLDEKIAKVRRKNKKQTKDENANEESEEEADMEEEEDDTTDDEITDKIKVKEKKKKKKKKKGQDDEEEEEGEKIEYAEEVETYDDKLTFQDMNLSRPLLKGLSSLGFNQPTPIQAATIPKALLGKDLCACAATGTGKTGAFMLPVLERLMYKPKQERMTRVLVLTPTRELAVQIHQVSRTLAHHTNISICLAAGGLDIKSQEAALRLGPDIVIATPGRLIDHLHNAPTFNLQNIEILILDEADRMLDEYFAEQMKEVIRQTSRTRQTMLFSATMTEEVQDLARVSLKDPIRIFVNQNTDVAMNLRQEFIRIRPNREGDREAIIAALVLRTFHDHCIVFIQTKRQAHRMHIVLGLLGVNVGELHGNLSQAQRLEALRKFKESEIDVLLATDLAARGLDIVGIKTVINFTMPNTIKHYIHRVGRTARAGRRGRAVTLVGEKERKLLKDIVKRASNPVKSRVVPQEVIQKYRDRIAGMEKDVKEIMHMEYEEKEMRASEIKVNKAQRMLEDPANMMGRPERTWFQTAKERLQEKAALKVGDFSALPSNKGKKAKNNLTKKLGSADDRAEFEIQKAHEYSVRQAKRERRPKRIRAFEEDTDDAPAKKKPKKKKVPTATLR